MGGQVWPHGRGPFRAAVHGHDEGEQAGEFHALDRWCLRGRPSRGSEEEQEVHPELCRRLHALDPPLEGAEQVLRMLGSSKGLPAIGLTWQNRSRRSAQKVASGFPPLQRADYSECWEAAKDFFQPVILGLIWQNRPIRSALKVASFLPGLATIELPGERINVL